MKDKPWYPIVYMFIVTAVLSGVLIGLSRATAERVARNEQVHRERAVLKSLGLADDKTSPEQVHAIYVARIVDGRGVTDPTDPAHEMIRRAAGAYVLTAEDDPNAVEAYVVPIHGQGYWDVIAGFVAIEAREAPDALHTVRGVAFYQQSETPGLGARITEDEFKNQFRVRWRMEQDVPVLTLEPQARPIEMVNPSAPLDEHSIRSLSGATQTSTRLARFMNEMLEAWRDEMTRDPAERTVPPRLREDAPAGIYNVVTFGQ